MTVLLSADNYLAFCFPIIYHTSLGYNIKTAKLLTILVIVTNILMLVPLSCWYFVNKINLSQILSSANSTVIHFQYDNNATEGMVQYVDNFNLRDKDKWIFEMVQNPNNGNSPAFLLYSILREFFLTFMPIIILLHFYVSISLALKRQKNNRRFGFQNTSKFNMPSSITRLTWTVLILLINFLLLSIPVAVINMIYYRYQCYLEKCSFRNLIALVNYLEVIKICINFYIYFFTNIKFRHAFYESLSWSGRSKIYPTN
ncbi:probable G-protein coupled receptor AH9.1 [Gordionus sp. m RMFG-2023]|uniref:probable G-protein coupled receptor AH9.1 n=1 Tax=Gordionus sp. m RMFG-2023 TaxID=3053472 RepID=UPI0031FC4660